MNYAAQKAALTRALKVNDPAARKAAVLDACKKVVRQWNAEGGYWPDDWSRWQRALDDTAAAVFGTHGIFDAPRLDDLQKTD